MESKGMINNKTGDIEQQDVVKALYSNSYLTECPRVSKPLNLTKSYSFLFSYSSCHQEKQSQTSNWLLRLWSSPREITSRVTISGMASTHTNWFAGKLKMMKTSQRLIIWSYRLRKYIGAWDWSTCLFQNRFSISGWSMWELISSGANRTGSYLKTNWTNSGNFKQNWMSNMLKVKLEMQ